MYFLCVGSNLHLMRVTKGCVCCVCTAYVLDMLIESLEVVSSLSLLFHKKSHKKPPRHRSATPPTKPRAGSLETTLSELQFWAWGPIFSRSREHRTLREMGFDSEMSQRRSRKALVYA
jgi:hypothetical protein